MNNPCATRAAALVEEFSRCSDWESRYRRVIEKGHALSSLTEDERTGDRYLIPGCVSRAWLVPGRQEGSMVLRGDSEAAIVKGIIALLVDVYSGASPEDVLTYQPDFLQNIGLTEHLSMNRRNGLAQFVKQIKLYAAVYSAQDQMAKETAPNAPSRP